MGSRSSRQDPIKTYRFGIEIEGFVRLGFATCTKLSKTTEQDEYAEGGMNDSNQKSSGRSQYPNITLTRGQIIDPQGAGPYDFLTWGIQVESPTVAGSADSSYRRTIYIIQYNRNGGEAARWVVREAWPCGYSAFGDLDGKESGNSFEELEICHEGFTLEGGPLAPGPGQSLNPTLGLGAG